MRYLTSLGSAGNSALNIRRKRLGSKKKKTRKPNGKKSQLSIDKINEANESNDEEPQSPRVLEIVEPNPIQVEKQTQNLEGLSKKEIFL